MARQQPLEAVDVEAVLVHRHADHPGTRSSHRGHHSDEGRRLDHRHVTGLQCGSGHEGDRLLGPGGDHDLVGVLGVAVLAPARGDLLAQLEQSLRVAVGQSPVALLANTSAGHPRELLGGVPLGAAQPTASEITSS